MRYLLIILFLIPTTLNAAYLYVDGGDHEAGVTWDDTDGHSYTSSAGGFPGAGTGYNTIAAAVAAVSTGDTIYMRGGTYNEYNIVIPNNIEGPAWTTLTSYPGEWAILDGNDVQDAAITHTAGFGEYQKRSLTNQTSYWKFERFEVQEYASAFWFSGGPIWFRYLYIHDCTSDVQLAGAIFITLPHDCIVEYCYFYNNNQTNPSNAQYGHVVLDADYRDDELPTTFDADVCTKKNIFRYNYFNTGLWCAHYKNQQRFGTNERTSATVIANYSDWGDKWHHNIIVSCTRNPLLLDQDGAQAYNNIISGGSWGAIQFGQEIDPGSDNCYILNGCAYNNTIISVPRAVGVNSGDQLTSSHPYMWCYNNVIDQATGTGYFDLIFGISLEMSSGYYADMSDVFIKNNLIHDAADSQVLIRGYADRYTLAEAQAAFASVAGNWDNDTAGLFSSGYITNPSFVLSGATTIANGGIGGDHPYLSGVTIPSYVGATNPADYSWVAGVLAMDADYFTLQTGGSDPTWIEGSESSPSTPSITGGFGGSLQ